MNKSKLSNPVRLIAFFLTAVILICTFGFTVDGWQIGEDKPTNNAQPGQPSPDSNPGSIGGENNEVDPPSDEPSEPEVIIPKYYNRITGLECSEEISNKAHLGFVMNPDLPLYGLSSADLVCEIPIEDGKTRLCVFISDNSSLWKIGSITQARGYISNIIKYFGGICISSGNDDGITYPSCDMTGRYIDLFGSSYQYTEFASNVYTNKDLLDSALSNSSIDQSSIQSPNLPFGFTEIDADEIVYDSSSATRISITQAKGAVTELKLNNDTGKYLLYRNGAIRTDAINNKNVEYKNCFVLFADSVTYDNIQCSQMVMDTIGSGRGYYFTNGSVTEISWTGSNDGVLSFYTLDGQKLICNRGSSYISFLKSSKSENLSYE